MYNKDILREFYKILIYIFNVKMRRNSRNILIIK